MPSVVVCVTVMCLSSYLELSLHRYGCESHVSLLEKLVKKPLSLNFLPSSDFLLAISFFLAEAFAVTSLQFF